MLIVNGISTYINIKFIKVTNNLFLNICYVLNVNVLHTIYDG